MCDNYRILSPVGMGGFDIEHIDGTTIVFDCGSRPMANVENCIIHYKDYLDDKRQPLCIDYLFLSHFDQDHVNGLAILAQHFKINNIIVPYIPKQYRVLYNYVTNSAVVSFYNLLANTQNYNLFGVKLLGTNLQSSHNRGYVSIKSAKCKWEWIYKSLFSCGQWRDLKVVLNGLGVLSDVSNIYDDYFDDFDNSENCDDKEPWEEKIERIKRTWNHEQDGDNTFYPDDGIYIEDFDIDSYIDKAELSKDGIKRINEAKGRILGESNASFAKNENGLLMLSKKTNNVNHICTHVLYPWAQKPSPYNHDLSACVYTGDMRFDVKSCPTILDFLRMNHESLLLFQIPHHGSPRNSSANYLQTLPSDLFFWHDKNFSRINKNTSVINNISPQKLIIIDTILCLVCDICI